MTSPKGVPQDKVALEVTLEQAAAISKALDLYTRIGMGQLEEVALLASMGLVPVRTAAGSPRQVASPDQCEQLRELMDQAKCILGFARTAHAGIGNPNIDITVARAYEVGKVLSKALAEHRNPAPTFRGVDYDGLGPRYTTDLAPVALVVLG